MKVYGIYQGCIYEGGDVAGSLYLSKETARKEALKLVKKENKWMRSANKSDPIFQFNLYKETDTDYWSNESNYICVQEFNVVE